MCSRPSSAVLCLWALLLVSLAAVKVAAESLTVESFESPDALARWELAGDGRLTDLYATHGRQSLRVRWPQGRGLISGGFPRDWSGWEVLKVDIHNPGPPVSVTLRAEDETGASASSLHHYLRTGETVLEFSIPGLAQAVDVSRIRAAHIRLDPPRERPVELYVDQIRFCRDEPPQVYQPRFPPRTAPPEAAGSLIANGDFESGLTGWRARGELDGGRYEFGAGEGENAHSGAASAAVICTRIGRGRLSTGAITVPSTAVWRLSFRVKATLGGTVGYGWTTGDSNQDLAQTQAGPQWRQVELEIPLEKGAQGQVHLESRAPGTVFFDEVRLVPGGENAIQITAEAMPGNRVKNPGFELGLHGWGSWGEWDGGVYELEISKHAHTGKASAAIACVRKGRGGIYTEPLDLGADTYTLRFMVAADDRASIRYGVVFPGGQMFQDTQVTRAWETLEITATADKEGPWRIYLMSTGEGTVYFDEVTLVGARPVEAPVAEETPGLAGAPAKLETHGGHTTLSGEPFFAVGVYGATAEDLRGTAFNVIPGWESPSAQMLDACAREGIYVLPDLSGVMRGHLPQQVTEVARPTMSHPAVLGWHLCYEPDHERWPVPPDEMRLARRLLNEADPERPTCAVVTSWAESSLYRYADSVDILMTNAYPLGEKQPAELDRIARATAAMRRAVQDQRPIWTVIQATPLGTPEEHLAAAWLAIVEGADGLFFWQYEDGARDPQVWAKVCDIAREIKTLRLVLTSPDAAMQAEPRNPEIRTVVKQAADGRYLLAVNGTGEDLGECAILLPGAADGPARVVFEDRNTRVETGRLKDSFGPFARHVYRLP